MLYYSVIWRRHIRRSKSSNIRRSTTVTSRSTIRDSISPAQLLIRLTGVNRPADLYTDSATPVDALFFVVTSEICCLLINSVSFGEGYASLAFLALKWGGGYFGVNINVEAKAQGV